MIDNDTYQFLAFLDLICLPREYRNESYLILLYHLIEQENDFGYIKTKYLSISWKYWGSGSAMFLMEVTQEVLLILVLLVLIPCFRVSFAIESDIFWGSRKLYLGLLSHSNPLVLSETKDVS